MKSTSLIALVITVFCAFSSFSVQAASHSCTPISVMTYSNRVHVRCSNPVNNIRYFALSMSSSSKVDRFLKIATTALVSEKQMYIGYGSTDTSGASFGCRANDCRKATSYGIKK